MSDMIRCDDWLCVCVREREKERARDREPSEGVVNVICGCSLIHTKSDNVMK